MSGKRSSGLVDARAFVLLPWSVWEKPPGLVLVVHRPHARPDRTAARRRRARAAISVLVGTWGRGSRMAGGTLLAVSTLGVLAALYQMATAGRAFGLGGFVCLLGLLTLAGIGLAQAGYVRGGAFVAAVILWTAGLIAIFILFPLLSMLQASVITQGHLTTAGLQRYLTSPISCCSAILSSPPTPYAGDRRGDRSRSHGPRGIRLIFARWTRALAWGMGWAWRPASSPCWAWARALRNSLFLAVSVGLISTGLGFIFALLESRSTLWTRRLLAPFSILPIITPAFVLGLAMIYMFGRRGFVTHTLLGLSTNVFFGPLGVGVAQVLAFTPIAYLVLVA